MKNLMRPGATMLSDRSRLTFEQKKRSLQPHNPLCRGRNRVAFVMLILFLMLIVMFSALYFDMKAHPEGTEATQTQNIPPIIFQDLEVPEPNNDAPISNTHSETLHDHNRNEINTNDLSITSRTSYISTLDTNHHNFLNLLHRRSLGFKSEDYDQMRSILTEYGKFAHNTIEQDIANHKLNGRYIIITPAAQMCNRMRALMGTMLLGILTQRVVFIDIGAEGYAARLNNIFISPGYEWEYKSIPSALKTLLNTAKKARWIFPYEWLDKRRPVSGIIRTQVCDNYCGGSPCKPGDNGNTVWEIDSHAAFLPVMARNENLYKAVLQWHEEMNDQSREFIFDRNLATFMGRIADEGQESIEILEVLLGRMMFRLEEGIQKAVDSLISATYNNAMKYYEEQGLDMSLYNVRDNPPPVIGIHIRSEYVLLMNPGDCKGNQIRNCVNPYNWFEECGVVAMDRNVDLNGIRPYVYIAADTKEAQSAAQDIFGADRVYFRPFDKTGGSFEGIQEAIIDLVSVSSFDVFVGTPHSSYSEMASILSQPRRIYNEKEDRFIFKWSLANNDMDENLIPVNRMIIPIMTKVGWEIDKLNLYTMGRTVDVKVGDNGEYDVLLPQTDENKQRYIENKICKQTITAGMGWMGLFHMLRNVQCYNPKWHHPSPEWFPVANE